MRSNEKRQRLASYAAILRAEFLTLSGSIVHASLDSWPNCQNKEVCGVGVYFLSSSGDAACAGRDADLEGHPKRLFWNNQITDPQVRSTISNE